MVAVTIVGKISIEGGPPQDFLAQGQAEAPRIWGGAPPYVDIGPPGPQPSPPGIWPPPGVVSPPIYYPPGIWPPAGVVSPPIYYPPVIWPTPPGGTPPEVPPGAEGGWHWAYDDDLGWVLVPPGGGGKPQPTP